MLFFRLYLKYHVEFELILFIQHIIILMFKQLKLSIK